MRDRLIEIVKQVPYGVSVGAKFTQQFSEKVTDHLLANGVIVPPCKVGQTVYCIRYDRARKPFVKPLGVLSITAYGNGEFTVFTTKEDFWCVTAFPTHAEAEKELERRSKNA